MAKRMSGLGRGLGALIPQREETPKEEPQSNAPVQVTQSPASKEPVAAAPTGAQEIPVGAISANPEQPRVTFRHRELEDLMNSIREHGIIQPLTVSPLADGTYELIAGERRFRAANMLGLKTVPVILRKEEPLKQKLVLALIENIQREDLNPMEEAKAYARLAGEFMMTQEEIAQKVGKARSTVANTMRLLDLPEEIQKAIADGAVTAGSARAILGLKDDNGRMKLFRKLLGSQMSTRDVEAGVRKRRGTTRKDPAIVDAEEQLRNRYGTRVDITKRDEEGKVTFAFHADEEYKALLGKLLK